MSVALGQRDVVRGYSPFGCARSFASLVRWPFTVRPGSLRQARAR